ncbi:carboxypeptidase-like regulatory domain-containing protein [Hymenobacter baengnokdamensis]|uniref:carboxypeptidase-like regulatory domain-containing protein n=1 Tax=Hymenobacter baengnokdamensis TaxID=2615203 RepID=UPI0012472312|nr:carboxypeptidase-like regulatory domain-containing protein [Hymenobacter baengnokdamensis]
MKRHSFFSFGCGLWLLCLLLTGCHSTDPTTGTTTVSGQVVTYQTNKPVPNATVQVYHLSSGGGYVPVGTGFPADKQGHFAFDFNADNKFGYLLMASAPPGYITDWGRAPSLTAGRANGDITIPTYAPAWFKLQLMNTSHLKRYSITIQGYSGSGELIYNPKDTVLIRPTQAIGVKTSVAWGIIDQATGSSSQGYQEVKPGPLDTVAVQIPF